MVNIDKVKTEEMAEKPYIPTFIDLLLIDFISLYSLTFVQIAQGLKVDLKLMQMFENLLKQIPVNSPHHKTASHMIESLKKEKHALLYRQIIALLQDQPNIMKRAMEDSVFVRNLGLGQLGFALSLLNNPKISSTDRYYAGFGIKHALSLLKTFLLEHPQNQDIVNNLTQVMTELLTQETDSKQASLVLKSSLEKLSLYFPPLSQTSFGWSNGRG